VYQTFGRHTPIQRCRVHKARNILERLPKPLHAAVRAVLRQAWGLDDADKAERLIRNLARRLEQQAPGVAASLLEGLDEILTVIRLGLPAELRSSLACTNIIEKMMGTVRCVCRNVKHWQDASMALRWTSAAHAGGSQRLLSARFSPRQIHRRDPMPRVHELRRVQPRSRLHAERKPPNSRRYRAGLESRLQQRRHYTVAGQRQVAEAGAEGVRDGVADGGDGGAAARFADAERGKVG
jgi:hypothetical protein